MLRKARLLTHHLQAFTTKPDEWTHFEILSKDKFPVARSSGWPVSDDLIAHLFLVATNPTSFKSDFR